MPPAIQAAILGVVQGVTEFLPVSSTAHLLISERILAQVGINRDAAEPAAKGDIDLLDPDDEPISLDD